MSFEGTEVPHHETSHPSELGFNLWHSSVIQTLRVVIAPLTSYYAYRQGLQGKGELAPWLYFPNNQEEKGIKNEVKKERQEFFGEVATRIQCQDRVIPGATSQTWHQIRSNLETELSQILGSTYHIFDECTVSEDGTSQLIAKDKQTSRLRLVQVKPRGELYLPQGSKKRVDNVKATHPQRSLAREQLLLQNMLANSTLINISEITNNIMIPYDSEWGREKSLIQRLAFRGSDSHDEIETVISIILTRGIELSPNGNQVILADERARSLFEELLAWSEKNEENYQKGFGRERLRKRVEEVFRSHLYFRYASTLISSRPDIVKEFLSTPIYGELERAIVEQSLISAGHSHTQKAVSILANTMLWSFEGYSDMSDSPTQTQYADKQHAFEQAREFLKQHQVLGEQAEGRPISSKLLATMQYRELRRLRKELRAMKVFPASIKDTCSVPWRAVLNATGKVVYQHKLRDVKAEIKRREKTHLVYLNAASKLLHVDPERRHSVLTTLLGNLLMAKVLGDKDNNIPYTALSSIPNTLGFVLNVKDQDLAKRLLALDLTQKEKRHFTNIESCLEYIFNDHEFSGESRFVAQSLRIVKAAPYIMQFLATNKVVPENVRQMSREIKDPQKLITQVLKLTDPVWADDPHHANMLTQVNRSQFHAMMYLTWVKDFVTAIETEYKIAEGILPSLERRFLGWKPLSEQVTAQDGSLRSKILSVLNNASRRIAFVNHDEYASKPEQSNGEKILSEFLKWPKTQPTTLRDYLDIIETMFASHLPSAEFIRKRAKWNKWVVFTMESWRCACALRDSHSFFNTRTAVAY